MSYRNNQIGYPKDILSNRSIIKKDNYALIEIDGLVNNVIPGFENCKISILSSSKLGASFVDYVVTMLEDGHNSIGFGGDGIETFVYVISGKLEASDGQETFTLEDGGYLFVPDTNKMYLKNVNNDNTELFLYKRRYKKITSYQATTYSNNIKHLDNITLENMEDVELYDLLPTTLDYDMNFHILTFNQGASHGYVETHVQEHGALILSGEGMYNLDNEWMPVKKNDYLFMASYCPQAAYGIGRKTPFSYLYSKDCNRDEDI